MKKNNEIKNQESSIPEIGKFVSVNLPNFADNILGVTRNEVLYYPLESICKEMGLDFNTQHKKLRRHPVLKDKYIKMPVDFQDGTIRIVDCIEEPVLFGWLFLVSPGPNEKPTEKLIAYRKKCFAALSDLDPFGIKAAITEKLNSSEIKSPEVKSI